MRTIEYLDALRARLQLPSDYALAKAIGVTRQMVSEYRSGRRGFGDEVALRVAELLDLPPAKVLADMAAERAQSEAVRRVWRDAAKVIAKAARATTAALLGAMIAAAAVLAPVDNSARARQINGLGGEMTAISQCTLCALAARLRTRLHRWWRSRRNTRKFAGQFEALPSR